MKQSRLYKSPFRFSLFQRGRAIELPFSHCAKQSDKAIWLSLKNRWVSLRACDSALYPTYETTTMRGGIRGNPHSWGTKLPICHAEFSSASVFKLIQIQILKAITSLRLQVQDDRLWSPVPCAAPPAVGHSPLGGLVPCVVSDHINERAVRSTTCGGAPVAPEANHMRGGKAASLQRRKPIDESAVRSTFSIAFISEIN